MRDANQQAVFTPVTVEEYIQFELKAERRHEYINGQLFEMPGEKAVNNRIAGCIYVFLFTQSMAKGFQVYINDVKVGIPGGTKYYYPDVFVSREPENEGNHYIKYEPELIAEVISTSSYITDTVDKYLAYTTIPFLKYYLLVQPETVYVTLFSRNADGEWEATVFAQRTDVVPLPLLDINLPLAEVYR